MMRILEDRKDLERLIGEGDLVLFLDYDGTLAPITNRPETALLSLEARSILKEFASDPACRVHIVSGRALEDIKRTVDVEGIGYVGNHGLEMNIPHVVFGNFDFTRTREVLAFLKSEIEKSIAPFKGAFIEDKGIVLSVHYRLVDPQEEGAVKNCVERITASFVSKGEVRIGEGKKVVEIKPPIDWDKGDAVLWLCNEHEKVYGKKPVVVYIGDDLTDEDAFVALKGRGLTVKVGEGSTAAEYVLKDQPQVAVLLKEILSIREKGKLWEPEKI